MKKTFLSVIKTLLNFYLPVMYGLLTKISDIDGPSPANLREYPHKTYLAIETRISGLHFCR